MATTVVVGTQWGDEGKGKLLTFLRSNLMWLLDSKEATMLAIPFNLQAKHINYT